MKTNRLKTDYFDPGESRSKREKGKRKRRKHARGTNLLDRLTSVYRNGGNVFTSTKEYDREVSSFPVGIIC